LLTKPNYNWILGNQLIDVSSGISLKISPFFKMENQKNASWGKIICKIDCHLFESAPRDHL